MAMLEIHPSVARKALSSIFTSQPVMLAQINDMHDALTVVFYSFCRGDKLTTTGNNIEADYEVLRLSAALNELEKDYLIPVNHCNVSTSSIIAGGKKTAQMYYVMDKDVVSRLQSDPGTVFREQDKALSAKRWERKQKQTQKLIEEHGGLTGALMMLTRSEYKDKSLDDKELMELERKFRDILDELDEAS